MLRASTAVKPMIYLETDKLKTTCLRNEPEFEKCTDYSAG